MDILRLFETKSQQLFWRRIDPPQLAGVDAPQPIEPGQAYCSIRLCEMYLATARKLWRDVYPMVHSYAQFGTTNLHVVASPSQLADLGNANLDRIANLNVRLGGPFPYNGEEIALLIGLYAVPGNDATKSLIDVVSGFASFDPLVAQATALANLVKTGVESVLGLDHSSLHLGIRDAFNTATRPLSSGFWAGIEASAGTVDLRHLWVVNGRLCQGANAATATPYSDHDYMLVSVERTETRADFRILPELQDIQKKFANIVEDTQFTVDEKRVRLGVLWPLFIQTLANSPNLTDPDRDRIAALITAELTGKLKVQSSANPFLKAA
jgi:hypothetical protein